MDSIIGIQMAGSMRIQPPSIKRVYTSSRLIRRFVRLLERVGFLLES